MSDRPLMHYGHLTPSRTVHKRPHPSPSAGGGSSKRVYHEQARTAPRSQTRTITKKKKKVTPGDQNYSGGVKKGKSWSFQLKGVEQARLNKIYRKVGAIGKWLKNNQSVFNCGNGEQIYFYDTFATKAELDTCAAAARNQLVVAASVNQNTQSNAGAAAGTKVFIQYSMTECYFRNQSVTPIFLTIYPFYIRKDMSDGMYNLMINDWAPDAAIDLNESNQITTNIYKQPGYKPFDNTQLCKNVKIKGTQKFFLQAGETVVWKTYSKFNKFYDPDTYTTGTPTDLRGWTHGLMFSAVGAPVMQSDDATNCDFPTIRLSYNVVQRFSFRPAIAALRNHIDIQNNVSAFPQTKETAINEVIGQVFQAGTGILNTGTAN